MDGNFCDELSFCLKRNSLFFTIQKLCVNIHRLLLWDAWHRPITRCPIRKSLLKRVCRLWFPCIQSITIQITIQSLRSMIRNDLHPKRQRSDILWVGWRLEKGQEIGELLWCISPRFVQITEKFHSICFSSHSSIAMRFGMMQTRVGIISLLSRFKFLPCAQTPIPMAFGSSPIVLSPKDPVYLKIVPI